ncbi:nuclear transport factor 2 family protein [Sphingobium sp.]|uniref:nuclear transport factor 2 family protein n=1 Tax=Sphingobium sp. TaxID=1912891 RepID=UPI002C248239|nr:nuclear transport factor 2 family protein [Sphingobium sp.]HUD92947.1 nuclear transport factor 2 family protein [Sphingobium sp.]
MPLIEAQLEQLYDEKLLQDNLMLYCRAADRMDIEGVRATYWPDSHDDHGGYMGPGQQWADAIEAYRDNLYSCNHHCSNVLCEIDGSRAKRESSFLCVAVFKNPDVTMTHGGRYRDLCEKREGEWRVLRRTCIWDWCDVRKYSTGWDISGVPYMSNWGDRYPNDPIYKDWFESPPTPRPSHHDTVERP